MWNDTNVKRLKELWETLNGKDAPRAAQAALALAACPEQTVEFLGKKLQVVPLADEERLDRLVADLDSDQFSVRQKAQGEVELRLAGHERLLRQTLAKATTLELRQRLEWLLERLHPERLRRARMLEILERIGVGPARRLLQTLAAQTEDVETAREAAAGLERMPHCYHVEAFGWQLRMRQAPHKGREP